MAQFSPRSRALTRDVIWSLGAAVVAVSLMGPASGLFSLSGMVSTASADDVKPAENTPYVGLDPQFDRTGTLTDGLPFAANQPDANPPADPKDTGTSTSAENNDSQRESTTGTAQPTSESPRASQQTTGDAAAPSPTSRTQPSDTSAERTPTQSSSPPPEPTRQQQIEAIADGLPFNWRAAGVTLKAECAPNRSSCRWGLYVVSSNTVWVGTDAFANRARLFYVVAHELVHAWQFSNDPYARMNDLANWGYSDVDGLEAAADCLAQAWGATVNHYWSCPADAQRHMTTVFNGT